MSVWRVGQAALLLTMLLIPLAFAQPAAAQTCNGTPGRAGTIEIKQGTMTRIFVVRVPADYTDGRHCRW